MKLLQEAMTLAAGNTAQYTVPNFQKLVELQDNAKGDEAALIGRVVEGFIGQAPVSIMNQIMRLLY